MDNQNNNKNDKNNRQNYGIIIITTIVAAVFVMILYQFMQDTPSQEISYTKFMEMVKAGEVKEVTFESNKIRITPKTEAEKQKEDSQYDYPPGLVSHSNSESERIQTNKTDAARILSFRYTPQRNRYRIT